MCRSLLAVSTALALLVFGALPVAADDWTDYDHIGPTFATYEGTYPDICKRYDLGLSVEGRSLWALRISDNVLVEEDEPEFKYISTMHGDEVVGTKMCMLLIEYLLENYGTDPQATNIIDEIELWIVPLMNPDGYEHTPRTRYNAHGVDLNRNFPQYGDPDSTEGREPETAVIMDWDAEHTFVCSANMHTGALVVNYPFDNEDTGSRYTPDDDMFIYISEEYSRHNPPMWGSPYFYHGITNGADWYMIWGGMQDWNYLFRGCNEVTLELSDIKEPSPSEIPQFWEDNRDSMMAYIETCLIGIRGIVTDVQTGQPLEATVVVVGRDHEIYSDPDVGDYHRMLLAGTYDLTFEVEGYDVVTIPNVVVLEGEATRLDVVLGIGPPVTQDVNAVADAGIAMDIGLLGYDPNNDPLDFIITTLPLHGSLSDPGGGPIESVPYTLVGQGNRVTYSADEYTGPDSFEFKANDGGTPPEGGDSNTSTVYVTVRPAPPVITTASLPDGYLDQEYGPVQLEASGGEPPLEWSVISDVEYTETDLGSCQFDAVGTAQGWHDDDDSWTYALPFTFPFYDGSYTSIRVCSNGFIDFGSFSGSTASNSTEKLISNKMIAPLWDDLRTDRMGTDIYIDATVPGEVTIRWDAVTYSGELPVNVSLTLTEEGVIRFHYGRGNTQLTPTVGLSNGDGTHYLLASYDGSSSLTYAKSLEFILPGGLPEGMTLDAAGQLGGTPTEWGSFEPVFVVTDDLARADQRTIPLVIHEVVTPTGDFEPDGDVDLADFAAFQRCFGQAAAGACGEAFEFVPSGAIDLDDFAVFEGEMTGPQG